MRVVLAHTRGRLKGLMQILGTINQIKNDMGVAEMPTYIAGVDFGDHRNDISLVAIKRSYALYRELIIPEGLGEFHSNQV